VTFDTGTAIALVLAIGTVITALWGARQQAASALSSTSTAAKQWREPLEKEIAELRMLINEQNRRIDDQDDELRELRWGVQILIRQLVEANMIPQWQPRDGSGD
jgi:chromosome segregation ATPase